MDLCLMGVGLKQIKIIRTIITPKIIIIIVNILTLFF